ncbi:unnamed protein product [Closterium sp. NIES-64]|nr:unnamed protein product [Closterium sp. NIES-64]
MRGSKRADAYLARRAETTAAEGCSAPWRSANDVATRGGGGWRSTPEQGAEDKEEGSGRSDEEARIEGANEARTGETGDAKTKPAEAQAETSPVAVAELEAPPPGSCGRDDPHEEGRRTESSGRQELGGPEMSHRAWQASNPHGKGKEERSRSAERERRLRGGRVGEFRPRGERQEQGEWSGGASHSAGRQQPRGERGREAETASPKWHSQ